LINLFIYEVLFMKTLFLFLISGLILFTSACSDDNNGTNNPGTGDPIESKLVQDLVADSTGGGSEWVYFNFAENEEVAFADSASAKWDIAFRTTSIICNSGVRGPGNGAIQLLTGVNYAAMEEAPADGYFQEDDISPLAIDKSNASKWYNYNPQTHIITPVPGTVLVLQTADGKYVKVRILSYYQGAPENPTQESKSRHYTFEFVYQPDGTRSFTK